MNNIDTHTKYSLPDGKNAIDYLRELCQSGLEKRYDPATEKVQNRLNYELGVIKKMGFVDYFLIVWDIVRFAKSNGIMVGPGRGSAVGSIVCYTLGITNVDPIHCKLMFERFINPNSANVPDINIDFTPEGRQKVIEYVAQKYGTEQIFKMDFIGLNELAVIDNTVRLIKKTRGIDVDIENISYDKKEVYDLLSAGDTEGVFLLESAEIQSFMQELKPKCLEEITAGIALYRPGAITEIPAYIRGKNNPETIVYKHPILKQTLDETYGCLVYQEQVMELAQNLAGYTLGKADSMRRVISKKKTEQAEIERKNFIYGSDDSEIPGCIKNGINEKTAISIFDDISDFVNYTFNKSHAAAYALLTYQTAYLKTFYTAEYTEALKSSIG